MRNPIYAKLETMWGKVAFIVYSLAFVVAAVEFIALPLRDTTYLLNVLNGDWQESVSRACSQVANCLGVEVERSFATTDLPGRDLQLIGGIAKVHVRTKGAAEPVLAALIERTGGRNVFVLLQPAAVKGGK